MTVHTLKGLMDLLAGYPRLTPEEQEAARVLGIGVERVLPKGRIWPVLSDDADPAILAIEAIGGDVAEIMDTLALIEDRLTELKRVRHRTADTDATTPAEAAHVGRDLTTEETK